MAHGFQESYQAVTVCPIMALSTESALTLQGPADQRHLAIHANRHAPKKYLNSIPERDHHSINSITKPMVGFEAFHSAEVTLAGIKVAHMIFKRQITNGNAYPRKVFTELAGIVLPKEEPLLTFCKDLQHNLRQNEPVLAIQRIPSRKRR